MSRQFFYCFFLFILTLMAPSCKNTHPGMLYSVEALIGKELTLPYHLIYFNDPEQVLQPAWHDSPYRILIYFNPYTCSICKIKEMRLWDEYYQRFAELGVNTMVLVDTDDMMDYKKEVDLQKVKPLFAYDVEGQFTLLNKLPDNPVLHAFLLKGNTIVLVGNPYLNPRLFELYLKTIES